MPYLHDLRQYERLWVAKGVAMSSSSQAPPSGTVLHCPACLRERGAIIYYDQRQKYCAVCQSESLEPLNLGELAQALPTVQEVLADSTTSHWIKQALSSALLRDPVDAANDAELLARLLDSKSILASQQLNVAY
jgi:hypothetical protein